MKYYPSHFLLILLPLLFFSSAIFAIDIETYQGAAKVDARPKTIAVFDIPAIDTIGALDVQIQGVPNNLYLERLRDQFKDQQAVGSLFELDLEALNALSPDLIVVGGRSSTQLDQAKRIAPAIDMTIGGVDLFDQVRNRITDYGKLFEKQAQAKSLVNQLDEKLKMAKQAVKNKGTGLIVMTNGPKISVYGSQSRFGWLHQTLALPEAMSGSGAGNHGEAVSFEFIAKANPDWLLVLDRAAAIGSSEQNAKVTLDNALVQKTKAWQQEQVVYLPSAEMYIASGGFNATMHVLDTIIAAFSKAP